jgi:hypothetical protein
LKHPTATGSKEASCGDADEDQKYVEELRYALDMGGESRVVSGRRDSRRRPLGCVVSELARRQVHSVS